MGHFLRELSPWFPEVLAGGLENSTGPGDPCGQVPQVRWCLHSSPCAPAVPTGPLLCLSRESLPGPGRTGQTPAAGRAEVRQYLLPKEGKS